MSIKTPIDIQNNLSIVEGTLETKQDTLVEGTGIELQPGTSEKFDTANNAMYTIIYVNTYATTEQLANMITDLTVGSSGNEVVLLSSDETFISYYGSSTEGDQIVAQASVVNDTPYWKMAFKSDRYNLGEKRMCYITKSDDTYSGGWENVAIPNGAFDLNGTTDLTVNTTKASIWNGKLIGKAQFENKTTISTKTPENVPVSTTIKTIWSGTTAQYEEITEKDTNTLYIMTE